MFYVTESEVEGINSIGKAVSVLLREVLCVRVGGRGEAVWTCMARVPPTLVAWSYAFSPGRLSLAVAFSRSERVLSFVLPKLCCTQGC